MKFIRSVYFSIGLLCCTAASGLAEDLVLDDISTDEDVIAIYGAACEKIKNGEAKSSLRVRATDKASFEAVSSISELAQIKKELDPHDFNVMIYDMVDNYVEDLAARTTKQDETNICVEVTGYLKKDNIITAVQQTFEGRAGQDFTENKTDSADSRPTAETGVETTDDTVLSETSAPDNTVFVAEEASTKEVSLPQEQEPTADDGENKINVFVAPTVFFNDTESETHAQNVKTVLERSPILRLTNDAGKADFVVKSNVLRAKIDPINSNTSRLQMVVSVTIENTKDKTSSTEHQNRFVLFSSSEDEQAVAGKLMRKLFEKATESVLPLLEKESHTDKTVSSLPQMITPSSVKLYQETDAN